MNEFWIRTKRRRSAVAKQVTVDASYVYDRWSSKSLLKPGMFMNVACKVVNPTINCSIPSEKSIMDNDVIFAWEVTLLQEKYVRKINDQFRKNQKTQVRKNSSEKVCPKKQVSFEKIRKRRSEKTCRKKFVRKSRSEKWTMEFARNGSNCVFMISVDLGLTSRIARIQRLTYTSNSYINPSLLPSSICTDFFSYFYHASLLLRCVFWLICVFLEKDFIGDSSHWFCIIYLSPVDYCYF